MKSKIFSRQNIIGFVLILAIALLVGRLANLTILHGEEYAEKAINNRIKRISEVAKRGEIYDRNGILLAGNSPAFTVQMMADGLSDKVLNRVSVEVIDLLDEKSEDHISFPITFVEGELVYTHDIQILNWLKRNGYEQYASAEQVFEDFRYVEQISDSLDKYEAQQFLIRKGISLPISVKTMKYLDEMRKEDFLKSFDIPVEASPKEALDAIRSIKSYGIEESVSDEDALKMLTVRYALRLRGYLAYEPIQIASSVSEETAVLIQEMGMAFPGVNIAVEPIRSYPQQDLGAHILGYLGKISSESEIAQYIEEKGYDRNDMIGKTGVEEVYEDVLKGQDGYRYIEVDAYGRYVKDADPTYSGLESVLPVAGGNLTLTIDSELQKVAQESLEKWLSAIQAGGTHPDPWGDITYDAFEKAETGSVVVVDVKTGEILSLANYPSYDPNLFATGITSAQWNMLTPDNPKNPLAPRPLYNTATLTAVQPGSTFKMITGLAAMEQGLDPETKLYSDGFVEVGNNTFGCWFWNDYHGKHGPTDLYHALEVSCNYYFFDLAMGWDYRYDRPLDFDMNASILVDYARMMGLDEGTGIEIPEMVRGVPDEEKKTSAILWGLKIRLGDIFEDYFPAVIAEDDDLKEEKIREILSWAEDKPSRAQIIRDLTALGAVDDYRQVEALADIIKYDYFNRIGWFEGDVLNMSIGQGDHLYTPVQMARYIMGIANDGYLHELTLIQSIDGQPISSKQSTAPLFKGSESFAALRQGMYDVAQGASGTARKYFFDFPIEVGAKTGTAEKEGKIPPIDEVTYLRENLTNIDPNLNLEAVEALTQTLLLERNEELAGYEKQKDEVEDPAALTTLSNKIDTLIATGYLTEGSAMREAMKSLSDLDLTDTIINRFRDTYDNYAWFVGFAPYEDPEIAIVVFLPQGGHGGYATPIARDIMAQYFGIEPEGTE